MQNSNLDLTIYRKDECVDDHGVRIKNCDEWLEIGTLNCVVIGGARHSIERQIEVEQEVEITNFDFDSQDQVDPMPEPQKDDYVGFVMDGVTYVYKVRTVKWIPTFNFGGNNQCSSYNMVTERIIPRECPKALRKLFRSDTV